MFDYSLLARGLTEPRKKRGVDESLANKDDDKNETYKLRRKTNVDYAWQAVDRYGPFLARIGNCIQRIHWD